MQFNGTGEQAGVCGIRRARGGGRAARLYMAKDREASIVSHDIALMAVKDDLSPNQIVFGKLWLCRILFLNLIQIGSFRFQIFCFLNHPAILNTFAGNGGMPLC
jgi:hypothetical protein